MSVRRVVRRVHNRAEAVVQTRAALKRSRTNCVQRAGLRRAASSMSIHPHARTHTHMYAHTRTHPQNTYRPSRTNTAGQSTTITGPRLGRLVVMCTLCGNYTLPCDTASACVSFRVCTQDRTAPRCPAQTCVSITSIEASNGSRVRILSHYSDATVDCDAGSPTRWPRLPDALAPIQPGVQRLMLAGSHDPVWIRRSRPPLESFAIERGALTVPNNHGRHGIRTVASCYAGWSPIASSDQSAPPDGHRLGPGARRRAIHTRRVSDARTHALAPPPCAPWRSSTSPGARGQPRPRHATPSCAASGACGCAQ